MSELAKRGPDAAATTAVAKQDAGTPGRETLPELHGDGMPLTDKQRAKYEPTFGTSLADVRVHTGGSAAAAADAVNAKAYATGNNVVFGAGHDPHDERSERLLSHELAHVVQQRGAAAPQGPIATTEPGDSAEREADTAAESVAAGKPASITSQPQSIARETKGEEKAETPPEPSAENPETVLTFAESWFKATPFTLPDGAAGGVQVTDVGDKVRIQSPELVATSTATLDLPADQTLEGRKDKYKQRDARFVHVGPIQTLMSSNRVGIYRKDGKTSEHGSKMGQVRDVAPVTYDVAANAFGKEGPFYSGNPDLGKHKENKGKDPGKKDAGGEAPTSELGSFSGAGNHFETQVVMIDQPAFSLPKVMPDGARLVGTKGSDEFNTSAGFKTSTGQVVAKSAFGWRVSWNREINTEKPQAEQKQPDKQPNAIEKFDVEAPVVDDTPAFAVALGNIKSVEDAAAKGADWNFRSLPRARTACPEAVPFMEQALAKEKITITIKPTKSAAGGGESTTLNFNVSPAIHKSGATQQTSGLINQPKSATYTFSDLANVGSIQGTESVNVAVNEFETGIVWGTNYLGGTATVAIGGSGTISEGDSVVQVSVSWGVGKKS